MYVHFLFLIMLMHHHTPTPPFPKVSYSICPFKTNYQDMHKIRYELCQLFLVSWIQNKMTIVTCGHGVQMEKFHNHSWSFSLCDTFTFDWLTTNLYFASKSNELPCTIIFIFPWSYAMPKTISTQSFFCKMHKIA